MIIGLSHYLTTHDNYLSYILVAKHGCSLPLISYGVMVTTCTSSQYYELHKGASLVGEISKQTKTNQDVMCRWFYFVEQWLGGSDRHPPNHCWKRYSENHAIVNFELGAVLCGE